MTGLGKRRRADTDIGSSDLPNPQPERPYPNDALAPATDQDKLTWKGWCEIESEPSLFNVMIKEFGVPAVKTLEVLSLDDDSLAQLPNPVYGLVFLFQYKDEVTKGQVEDCPKEVWFANQTSMNSCASVALLNILNNLPNVDLGDNLASFKEFTKDFTPALRGNAIDNYEFVKHIHNSFARKMDMLDTDLCMKNNVDKAGKKTKVRKGNDDDYEACYHFIGYVPVNGQVWSLDGLQRHPTSLGNYNPGEDWVKVARPFIIEKMSAYENDEISFNLLALVRKPVLKLREELELCNMAFSNITARLREILPSIEGPCPITTTMVENAEGLAAFLTAKDVEDEIKRRVGNQNGARNGVEMRDHGSDQASTLPDNNAGNGLGGQQGVGNPNGIPIPWTDNPDGSPQWSPTSPPPESFLPPPPPFDGETEYSLSPRSPRETPYSPDEVAPQPAERSQANETSVEAAQPIEESNPVSSADNQQTNPALEPHDPVAVAQQAIETINFRFDVRNPSIDDNDDLSLKNIIPTNPISLILECSDLVSLLGWARMLNRGIRLRKELIKQEEESEEHDEAQAASRRWDYGPFIRRWLTYLIRNGTAKEIYDDLMRQKKEKERLEKEKEKEIKKAITKSKGKSGGRKKGRK